MAENYIDAENDYMLGMKYKDIATKYGVTINTVKSWKQRYGWSREKKGVHTKEKVCTQKKRDAGVQAGLVDDGTKETLNNGNLTSEQQLFCIYYSRTFNAAQSYQKVYGCSYESALCAGSRLLGKVNIRAEVERLKEIKRQQIVAGADDIVELQMRIAFADMGEIVYFDQNGITMNDSNQVDTQLIRKVKEGREGISVEVEDRQKAIDWLTKYFLMYPDDKYKAEYNRMKAESDNANAEAVYKNIKAITEVLTHPAPNRKVEDFEGGKKDEHAGAIK